MNKTQIILVLAGFLDIILLVVWCWHRMAIDRLQSENIILKSTLDTAKKIERAAWGTETAVSRSARKPKPPAN